MTACVAEQEEFDVGMPLRATIPRPARPRRPHDLPPWRRAQSGPLSGMDDLGGAAGAGSRFWEGAPQDDNGRRAETRHQGRGLPSRRRSLLAIACFLSAARAANGCPASSPAGGGIEWASGLRGYGSIPRMRNSVARAPRSIVPSIRGSGPSFRRGSSSSRHSPRLLRRLCGGKRHVDRLLERLFHRLQRHHASLPTVADTCPTTRRPSPTATNKVEDCARAASTAQPGELGDSRARRSRRRRDRNAGRSPAPRRVAPARSRGMAGGLLCRRHCFAIGGAAIDCSGSGKATSPRAKASPSCAASAATAART